MARPGFAPLDFDQLRKVNEKRVALFMPDDPDHLTSWSETDWACAAAGEMGEMCNFIKKRRRGDGVTIDPVAKEMADVIIYLDLLAARMGIDLGEAVRDKYNEVSARSEHTQHLIL